MTEKRLQGQQGRASARGNPQAAPTVRMAQAPYAPKILPKHCAYAGRDGERCRGFHTKDSVYCAGHKKKLGVNA